MSTSKMHAHGAPLSGNRKRGGEEKSPHTNGTNGNGSAHDESRYAEPIAIIGIGCRLPGNTNSPSKLWEFLKGGQSGHCEIPASRFNPKSFYNPDVEYPGTLHSTGGSYLQNDIHLFENSFFGINNLEAKYMDPQQRQLLEVVFECFESSGTRLEDVSGTDIGSYVANFTTDYTTMQSKDPEMFHRYGASGMEPSILANRISHVFNLTGPSCVVNTACSSSLYCLHLACVALEARECDSAIVAGANLIQSPEMHIGVVKLGVISPSSKSHSFDVSADGYGRGEAVGALHVKRLSDAVRDGDPIRAVIRGTAVNSNGKTNGITLPSADGQEAVIRKAYEKAGLPLNDTIYVEAHGTGTSIGDPIEIDAISRTFKHRTGKPTLVGSIKTNIGHSEAVSGISSVIKVVLALEKGMVPPTIGIQNINPALKLEERNVDIVASLMKWPKNALRRASVNSFGYGGANSHVIIDSTEMHVFDNKAEEPHPTRTCYLLPISGSSAASLERRVSGLMTAKLLTEELSDLAYTLSLRRTKLSHCGYLLARAGKSTSDLDFSALQTSNGGSIRFANPIAFVFTGQGAQWAEMGKDLFREFPTYQKAIKDLDCHLAKLSDAPSWSIQAEIERPAEESKIQEAFYSQVICTAIQIALTILLESWGVTPKATIGHSSGEIAAAFAAGLLSAEEAIAVAYYRGLVVSRSVTVGSMIAVGIDVASANKQLSELNLESLVRVACVNSPESVTLSGDSAAIDELVSIFQSGDVFVRKLKTDGHAYHSHHMSAIGKDYEDVVSSILLPSDAEKSCRATKTTRMFSSVTARLIDNDVRLASYWRSNLESPVLFQNAVESLFFENEKYHIIEVGPHSALEMPLKDIRRKLGRSENDFQYSPTLYRGKSSVVSLLTLIGNLYINGSSVDFESINGLSPSKSFSTRPKSKVLHDLPTYPWSHGEPIWSEPRISYEYRNREHQPHELLGSRIPGGSGQTRVWRNVLRLRNVPWLKDHKLGDTIVFPAAGYIGMANEAVLQLQEGSTDISSITFRNLTFLRVLEAPNENLELELFTEFKQSQITEYETSTSWWEFQISSFSVGESTVHARGSVRLKVKGAMLASRMCLSKFKLETQSPHTWYNSLAKVGLNFGPRFQSIIEVNNARKSHQTLAKTLFIDPGHDQSRYFLHPITLDAMLQTGIISTSGGVYSDLKGKVPVSIKQLDIGNLTSETPILNIHAESEVSGVGIVKMNAELQCNDGSGRVLARVEECRGIAYQEKSGTDDLDDGQPISQIIWKPDISMVAKKNAATLAKYIGQVSCLFENARADIKALAGAVDLLAHKRPNLRVLDLTERHGTDGTAIGCLSLFSTPALMKRFQAYYTGILGPDGAIFASKRELSKELFAKETERAKLTKDLMFDTILVTEYATEIEHLDEFFPSIFEHLSPAGTVLAVTKELPTVFDNSPKLDVLTCNLQGSEDMLTLARYKPGEGRDDKMKDPIILIHRDGDLFSQVLERTLRDKCGHEVIAIHLNEVSKTKISPKSTVVATLEIATPFLRTLSAKDLESLKMITDNSSRIIWITAAGLFTSRKPDFSLFQGFSRALVVEQPSLTTFSLDLQNISRSLDKPIEFATDFIYQAILNESPEFEIMEHEETLYCSRFLPNPTLTPIFYQAQSGKPIPVSVKDADSFQLSISSTGQLDSLHFAQREVVGMIPPDHVHVEVKYVGLNAKDIYALKGKIDTKNAAVAIDHAGIVRKVGSSVTNFSPGDRVVIMAPSDFANHQYVPHWACCKLLDSENFDTFCTIPLAFSTAIYGLKYRANLKAGESVLIHSAAGGVGIAAIQIARLVGAEIYATVGSEDKKQFLVHAFGIQANHIFNSRDSSFVDGILAATSGKGVDVVLNSLTGEILHDGLRACADLGRFIEIGKRDIVDGGKLEMYVFQRGITFSAFDLSVLYYSTSEKQNLIWQSLLHESLQLLREQKTKLITPLKVFDVAEVVSAFQYFALRTRVGKIAVKIGSQDSVIQLIPRKYNSSFSSAKAYVLIGCLGGLGRSLARWMFKRGARKFVFIGRSGIQKPAAKLLVQELESEGGEVAIVTGDVSSYSVVEDAVTRMNYPVGGVVQGAMALKEALFTQMTLDKWHECIKPKVDGAWNLHRSLSGRDDDLDFFVMLSSVAGSIGTATETNYCAANTFLDAFAGYRRRNGLPATSVGLGMVSEIGYLHEHPDIEAALLRKGLHPITQDEFLQICDMAFTNTSTSQIFSKTLNNGPLAEAHILTGFGAAGLKNIRKQGFEGGNHVLGDPRASYLALSLADDLSDDVQGSTSSDHLPGDVAAALASCQNANGVDKDGILKGAIARALVGKFGNLVLVEADKLDIHTKFAEFGLDSMLAAEFRQFIFRTFEVDVRFPTLLAKGTTIHSLSELIAQDLSPTIADD